MFSLFTKTNWTKWTKILLVLTLLFFVLVPNITISQNGINITEVMAFGANPATSQSMPGSSTSDNNDIGCKWYDFICGFNLLVSWLLTIILSIIFGFFLSIASFFFNLTLNITVYSIGDFLKLAGVIKAWSIVRDLCNMVFIFSLLYTAIKIIIGTAGADAKKLITNIIIAALLVNFSGFFVRVAVDVSNLVAITFNEEISRNRFTGSVADTNSTIGRTAGLAANLVYAIKLTRVIEPTTKLPGIDPANGNEELSTKQLSFGALIVGFVFSFITGLAFIFILIYLSFVFLLRTLAIMIIFILSPAAIVGFYIPGGKGVWSKWWGHFKDNLLFAPLLLFNLYLVLLILDSGLAGNMTEYVGGVLGQYGYSTYGDALNALVFYAVAIGLLITGISTAKSASGSVGAMAGTAAGFAGGALLAGGVSAGSKLGSSKAVKKVGGMIGIDNKRLSNWYNGANDQKGLLGGASRQTSRLARAIGRTEVGKKIASPISSSIGVLGQLKVPGASQTGYTNWSKRFSGENKVLDEQLARRFNGPDDEDKIMSDKLETFQGMSLSEQERLYNNLSAEDKVKLENEASKLDKIRNRSSEETDDPVVTNISNFREKLKTKDKKELEKTKTKERVEEDKKKTLRDAKDLLDTSKTRLSDDQIKARIRAIAGKDFEEFFIENRDQIMGVPDIISSFNSSQLARLSDIAKDNEKTKISSAIKEKYKHDIFSEDSKERDPVGEASVGWLDNPHNLRAF